jgi:hypothetical protein
MKNVQPSVAAANWVAGMNNATAKITAGVNAVTEAPSTAAIAAIPRMVQGIQQAAADGRIQAGLARVTLPMWQQAMLTKGVNRVGAGATAAKPAMQNFFTQFLPFLNNAVQALPPRGDINANIQRAVAMMQANSQFKYQKQ